MGSRGPVNGPSGLDQFLTGDQDHPGFGAIGGTPDRREDVSKFRLGPIFARNVIWRSPKPIVGKVSRRPQYEVDQRLANASGAADRCRCQCPVPLRAVLKAALH